MPVLPIDNSYPAGAYQDNIVGRMKANGKIGNSDSFGNPSQAMQGDACDMADPTSTASGTVQNTDYVLNSIVIPAFGFSGTGRGIRGHFFGTLAANVNAKNIKLFFGATALTVAAGTTATGVDFYATLDVIRTALSTFTLCGTVIGGAGITTLPVVQTGVSQSELAAITISLTTSNTAAAAASGTGKGATFVFMN
jgi:hypothetical protein